MKGHAKIGGDTLRRVMQRCPSQSFLSMGAEIAYCHHEKFNGQGYPMGLAGEDIPLAARILALADVYDALRSKRVYKPSMPHEQAAEIIRKDCGSHFDPDVVAAFFSREQVFRELAVRMADDIEPAEHSQPSSERVMCEARSRA
jgi:response regulator RpfG family c-di-GMP phosphodiesterase